MTSWLSADCRVASSDSLTWSSPLIGRLPPGVGSTLPLFLWGRGRSLPPSLEAPCPASTLQWGGEQKRWGGPGGGAL